MDVTVTVIVREIITTPEGTIKRRNLAYEVMEYCKSKGYDDVYHGKAEAEKHGYFSTLYVDPAGDERIMTKEEQGKTHLALILG